MRQYFPLKYCGHRWLENGRVLERLLELVDKLQRFLQSYKDEKKFPKDDDRFPLLLESFVSPCGTAQYEFCYVIIREMEPFLTLFQAERPLAPFLFEKLKSLVIALLERFVRHDVIQQNCNNMHKLINLKFEGDVLLPLEDIDVGIGAKSILKKLKTVQKPQEREFRSNCRKLLISLMKKLFERCPLKYKLTLALSSLSPIQISSVSEKYLKKRFTMLVEHLYDCRHITRDTGDKAVKQYNALLGNTDFIKEAKEFDIYQDRLDDFYSRVLDSNSTIDLQYIVRYVLPLSHGNARIESGFSVNTDILETNMMEQSIVAQRLVYEGIERAGGVVKVEITPEMMKMVKASHRSMVAAKKEANLETSEFQKKRIQKRKLKVSLDNAVAEKKKLVEDMKQKIQSFD